MANRLLTSRWFLLGILWLSLLVLSVKFAVAWTTRSLSLGAATLQTLVTQLSIILSFLTSLKPQDYRRFQVIGHSYGETIISLGVWSFLSCGGLFLGTDRYISTIRANYSAYSPQTHSSVMAMLRSYFY